MCHKRGFITILWEPANFPKESLIFSIETEKYFPFAPKLNLLVDFSKSKKIIIKAMASFLFNNNNIKFISSDEISQYVDEKLIPIEKGGKRQIIIEKPPDVKPFDELEHLKISSSVVKEFKMHFSYLKKDKILN